MNLQKKLVVLAAPAALATGLVLTPANDAEAAIFHYNFEAEYSFLPPQITDVSLYDSIVFSGSFDTAGLIDAIAQPQRVQIDIDVYDEDFLRGFVTTNGQSYATDSIIALGRTTPYTNIDNVIIFDTYDSKFSLNDEVIYSFRCINDATISQSEADIVEVALMAIFSNCNTIYGNSYSNPDFIADVTSAEFSYEIEDAMPTNSVASPASSLALLGFAGLALTASRRRNMKPAVVQTFV